jgi:glycosyltransferase involved in cell wall biosynthesis
MVHVEGPIDIIEDGVNGFIFKRGDKDALTSSILNLLNNSKLSADLGKKAQSYAQDNFSVKSFVDKIESLYWMLGKS